MARAGKIFNIRAELLRIQRCNPTIEKEEVIKVNNNVLVVEDDLEIRNSLSAALSMLGYQVQLAANGKEAIEFLMQNEAPSLIFLDLMMPVMNGWQFRALQLKDPNIAGIPVIVITADGNAKQKTENLGCAAGLKKPFDFEEIVRCVQTYCK